MSVVRPTLVLALLVFAACAGSKGSAIPEDEYFLDPLGAETTQEAPPAETTAPTDPAAVPAYYEPAPAAPVAGPQAPAAAPMTAGTYKVRKGDTLYAIARNQLGNASRWKEIASLNGLAKPYVIKVGQELRMP